MGIYVIHEGLDWVFIGFTLTLCRLRWDHRLPDTHAINLIGSYYLQAQYQFNRVHLL